MSDTVASWWLDHAMSTAENSHRDRLAHIEDYAKNTIYAITMIHSDNDQDWVSVSEG
jgi:hypothetical protein